MDFDARWDYYTRHLDRSLDEPKEEARIWFNFGIECACQYLLCRDPRWVDELRKFKTDA